jgi:ABC-type Fe3+/spermidine/putrescine transport system ATPase subunit
MAELVLDRLGKRYAGQAAVAEVSLRVASGEFVSLLGPSGCGKTTVLRMVAGLLDATEGTIRIGEEDVTRLPPHKRRLGLVFQSYALFPHLSVRENVSYGLRRQGMRGAELDQRVNEALALVQLGNLDQRMPKQLSGGQQQRVALARAVAPRPRLLLLDEPLSNLDALLRDEMQIEIKRLQRETGITTVFVTHDQHEALSLSDRVVVMSAGRVQQVGTPEEIYTRPANAFVAGFIGRSSRLTGRIDRVTGGEALVRLDEGGMLALPSALPAGTLVSLVVRYDAIRLTVPGAGLLPGTVAQRSFGGALVQHVVRLEGGAQLVAEAPSHAGPNAAPGDEVGLRLDPAGLFLHPMN